MRNKLRRPWVPLPSISSVLAGLMMSLGLFGCQTAQIPYPLSQLPSANQARHPLRVAILPFEDDRDPEETNAEDGLFSYGGLDYEPTDLSQLPAPPGFVLAELLARHLVRAGSFREVVLVRDPSQAPDAQLLLHGRIRRARGYVEAEGQRKSPGPGPEHRRVIAEVFLSDVELIEPGPGGRRLLHADLGWSILEERQVTEASPSPWQVLGDALFESHGQLAALLEDAVLDGSFVALDSTALPETRSSTISPAAGLERLAASVPDGWSFTRTLTPTQPRGWRAEPRCQGVELAARQTQRFHRVLGPYRPTLSVWFCPSDLALELDHKVEFPAVYLGHIPGGANVFCWRLGPSSWRHAESELARFLSVERPASKYTFRVGAEAEIKTRR